MARPKILPGLVIRYEFDFGEDSKGRQMLKERPAAIVVAHGQKADDSVVIAPISHTPPYKGQRAIEIPPELKARLGLDDERSWVKLNEVNDTTIENLAYDMRKAKPDQWEYGMLPKGFFDRVQEGIAQTNDLQIRSRDENPRKASDVRADIRTAAAGREAKPAADAGKPAKSDDPEDPEGRRRAEYRARAEAAETKHDQAMTDKAKAPAQEPGQKPGQDIDD